MTKTGGLWDGAFVADRRGDDRRSRVSRKVEIDRRLRARETREDRDFRRYGLQVGRVEV